jgi:dipeptidyl aminopeptidase/acylaminoacyl peptidase
VSGVRWAGLGLSAIAAFAIGATGLLVTDVRRGLKFVHPYRVRVSPDEVRRAFGEIDKLEDVTLRTSDGLSLRGWFGPGRRRAAVILVHGLSGNRASLEPEAAVMARNGYGVLLFDSRAEGDSDGDTATWGDRERRDVAAALDFVSSRSEIDPARIALLGFSVGGSTVVMSAARDLRVHAVILYAVWPSLDEEIRTNDGHYGRLSWGPTVTTMNWAGVDFGNVKPIDHIAEIAPRPLLMIAGGHDEDTPLRAMLRVFARAQSPKQLWVVPEAHHGGVYQARPGEYESRVVSFLDASIGQDSTIHAM